MEIIIRTLSFILILFILPCFGLAAVQYNKIEETVSAVVLIRSLQYNRISNAYEVTGSGSGTIIDREFGLILTNYHVIANAGRSNKPCEKYYIYVTIKSDMPPVPAFEAVYIDGSKDSDVAILGITDKMKDSAVSIDELPSLEWKSSEYWRSADDLHLMEEIIIFGYPSFNLGPDNITITITDGTLSGFLNLDSENSYPRSWIKTNAQISFGNSGGAAIDSEGKLIGIPTAFLEDASFNKITMLKSLDLIDPYVQNARKIYLEKEIEYNAIQSGFYNNVYISDINFTNKQNVFIQNEILLSQETPILYAYFDYKGIEPGYKCSFLWGYKDYELIENFVEWEWDPDGSTYIYLRYNFDSNLYPGEYTLIFYIDGVEIKRSQVEIYS